MGREDNRDVARMSALLAGFAVEVSGMTVNRSCASGLEAVNLAARTIVAGEGDVLIAGGGTAYLSESANAKTGS